MNNAETMDTISIQEVLTELNETKKELKEYHKHFGDINFEEAETIEEWFTLWNRYVYELQEKEQELMNIKETYNQMEQEIINTTDFKEIYGKNNETVRKNHVRNELKDLVDTRHDLELRINFLKRRISYIKSLMSMQETLLKYGGNQI